MDGNCFYHCALKFLMENGRAAECSSAADLRTKVGCCVRSSMQVGDQMTQARIDAELSDAVTSDATAFQSLRTAVDELIERGGALGTPAARELYIEAMCTAGFFAESLAVETIAGLFEIQVEIYHYTHSERGEKPEPQAVFGIASKGVQPMRLLHLMGARHFDLLLPAA